MTENGSAVFRYSTPSLLREADNEEAERLLRYNCLFTAVFISIILVMGIPGNILTIIVLRRRHLKDNFMSLLLTWLAVSNLSVMLVNCSNRLLLGVFDINIRKLSTASCSVHRILSVVSVTMCNWLLILVTASREMYIANVQRTTAICKPWVIHVIVLGMYGLFTAEQIITTPPIQYASNSTIIVKCASLDNVKLKIFRAILLCYLPGTILVALNALMLYTVRKQVGQSVVSRTKYNPGHHLGLLVMLSNLLFYVSNVPFAIYYPLEGTVFDQTDLGKARDKIVRNITICLLFLSPAMNFLVYCCFGGRFRRELLHILEPAFGRFFSTWPSVDDTSTRTRTFTIDSPREVRRIRGAEGRLKFQLAPLARATVQDATSILKLRSHWRTPEDSPQNVLHESAMELKAIEITKYGTYV